MTRFLVLIVFYAVSCVADPQCNSNEYLNQCPVACASDYCPRSLEESKEPCPTTPNPCATPACKCAVNYRQASPENKTCIPTRQCPPFECKGLNEEFNPCPPLCPTDSCTQATPDGSCPKLFGNILILLICSPTCRCKKGFWRGDDGVCKPYAECPQFKESPAPEPEKPVPSPTPAQYNPDPIPQDDGSDNLYVLPDTSAVDGSPSIGDEIPSDADGSAPLGNEGTNDDATATADSETAYVDTPREIGSKSKVCGPNEVYTEEK